MVALGTLGTFAERGFSVSWVVRVQSLGTFFAQSRISLRPDYKETGNTRQPGGDPKEPTQAAGFVVKATLHKTWGQFRPAYRRLPDAWNISCCSAIGWTHSNPRAHTCGNFYAR